MAKRKLNKKNLGITIIITLVFTVTVLVIINALINIMFRHDYTYEHVDDLLDLPRTLINNDYLYKDEYMHYEDDRYYSITGIDVSSHQKDIDFNKVKEAGISFVYIRCGYRGYSEGIIHEDSYFKKNYEAAKKAGLMIGVYFFSQAIDEKEAIDEAYFVRDMIKGLDIDLSVAYDLESIDYDESRIDDLEIEEKTSCAMAFASKIEEFGYQPMIYTNLEWANNHYDLKQIMNYDIWYAQYNDKPDFPYQYTIWQYTDKGSIYGITVETDVNMMMVKK